MAAAPTGSESDRAALTQCRPHRDPPRRTVARIAPILAALLLAACANHAQTQAEADAAAAAAAADDAAKCKSFGLEPDTPKYLKCLDALADQRAQQHTNERALTANGLLGRSPDPRIW